MKFRQHIKTLLHTRGFTIVEVMVVVSILAILATLTYFASSSWRSQAADTEVKNALLAVASAMENDKNFGTGYPADFPSSVDAATNVVLELAASTGDSYCVNGYSTVVTQVRFSISSDDGAKVREQLCGLSTGTPPTLGGTVPSTPRGVDVAPSFGEWVLTGGVSYDASTKTISLAAPGGVSAVSPLVRVDAPSHVNINAQVYATQPSPYASLQPNGGWHMGIQYYGVDGMTLVTNDGGYTSNGCAQSLSLGVWGSPSAECSFQGGTNVKYVRVTLYAQSSGYASPDLQIRNLIITTS